MTDFSKQIDEIVKQFSAEASFSAAAMSQFMKLKDLSAEQEEEIKTLSQHSVQDEEKLKARDKKIAELEGRLKSLREVEAGWINREKHLQERENECLKNELTARYSEQRVEDHKNMVSMIFRNTTLRRTVMGDDVVMQPGVAEIRDQFGNITTYGQGPGAVTVPVKKDETETDE